MTQPVTLAAHSGWYSDLWLRLCSAVLLLVAWQAGSWLAGGQVLPGPGAVALSLYRHATVGQLWFHLGMTLWRVAASFVIAMTLGTALGILMGQHRRADRLLDLWLVLGLNVPALVIMILCYVWLGLTEVAAIVAVAANKIPTVAVTMREGARAVDRELLQVADVLKLAWHRRLARVYLPQLYPYLMASTRSGLALIWKIVLVVELLGRSNGVGFELYQFFSLFDITSILAYTAAFIIVVLTIEIVAVRPLERRLTRWRQ